MDETGFYITWLPYIPLIMTIYQRQGGSERSDGRREGALLVCLFVFA